MPFEEGFRLDDHEPASPVKELAETNHDKPKNSGRSLRSDLAFLEQRELLSEKKILRDEGDAGAIEPAEEGQQLRILHELACQIEFLRSSVVQRRLACSVGDMNPTGVRVRSPVA